MTPISNARTVDVHIRAPAQAINVGGRPDLIRTVRGAGYALDDRFAKVSRKAAARTCRHRGGAQAPLFLRSAFC